MIIQRKFSIRGVGKYLPKKKVSSSEIEKELGIDHNWIVENLGVETRYIATDESASFMGAEALKLALLDANIGLGEIDCLLSASATFDYIIPNSSSLIKHQFENAFLLDFPCIDINTVCTSFITALDYASYLLMTNDYENIAIVSSEISSKGVNPSDHKTYGLFGDGAAAIIVSKTKYDAGLINYLQKTHTESIMHTLIKGGGNNYHPKDHPYNADLYSFNMEGEKLLRSIQKYGPDFLISFFKKIPTSLKDTNWIIPHQASKLGHKFFVRLNEKRSDNIINNLAYLGNCIAASIPLALVESIETGKIKENDTCLLIGTAAGLSISGLLFKYSSK